jgi:hypothetical protein
MMMVLEAHKQQQQEQDSQQDQHNPAAAAAAGHGTAAAVAKVGDAATAVDTRQHGVQHTTVSRFSAAADEGSAAAAGMQGRRGMEDAAVTRGVQRSSYGSL